LFGVGFNSIKHSCSLKAILWMIIIVLSTVFAISEPITIEGMIDEWKNYDIDNCYTRGMTSGYSFNCDKCEPYYK
jgi:hypothetical protein